MAHWNDSDELELEYYVDGEVEDPRIDSGFWEGGLFAESGTGDTPEQAWARIKKQYESAL
jgi:hypothetical protein